MLAHHLRPLWMITWLTGHLRACLLACLREWLVMQGPNLNERKFPTALPLQHQKKALCLGLLSRIYPHPYLGMVFWSKETIA